jgi:hypothetical protein
MNCTGNTATKQVTLSFNRSTLTSQALVVHTCKPSYLGGYDLGGFQLQAS